MLVKGLVLTSVIVNIILCLIVYIRNPKRRINKAFTNLFLVVASWAIGILIFLQSPVILWGKFIYAFASLIPLAFLSFVKTFPQGNQHISKNERYFVFSLTAIFFALSWSSLLLVNVIETDWGYTFALGPLYFSFFLYFGSIMGYSLYQLFIKYKASIGRSKSQIRYTFAGIFLSTAIGITTAIFLPLLGFSRLYAIAPLSTLITVFFIAYAIIRHRLMDIRALVLKSVVYSLMIASAAAVYIAIIYYAKTEYETVVNHNVLLVVAGFVMVFGFQPLRRFLQRATDRIFAKGRYDPEKLLSQLGDLLSSKIELDDLTESALEALTKEMRLTRGAFVLVTPMEALEIRTLGYEKRVPTKTMWEKATNICLQRKILLVADEFEEDSEEKEILRNLNTEVLVPLTAEDKCVGTLALGEKRSGDMYTTQDLRILEIIAPEAAIAIQNAMLFKEKEKRIQELDALHNIALSLGSTLDLNTLLKQVIDEAIKVTDAETGSIMLVDTQTDTLSIKVARGIPPEIAKATRMRMGEGIAGWVAKTSKPLVLINGQDVRFQEHLKREEIISALTVPLRVREKVIGVLSVNRKKNTEVFTEDNLRVITSFAAQAAEAIENARLFENLENTFLGTISALAAAVDAKDHYTYGHSEMVTEFAVDTAKELMLPAEEIKKIEIASKLHDIGKIGIDGVILNKPGKLTPQERRIIEEHPRIAVDILKSVEPLKDIIPLILYHHERFDGTGYPLGLSGRSIPLGARILATADAFNAMVSDRPYRAALDIGTAMNELRKNAGTQFDPEIVGAFLRAVEKKLAAKATAFG